jgi:hypothetical protein
MCETPLERQIKNQKAKIKNAQAGTLHSPRAIDAGTWHCVRLRKLTGCGALSFLIFAF